MEKTQIIEEKEIKQLTKIILQKLRDVKFNAILEISRGGWPLANAIKRQYPDVPYFSFHPITQAHPAIPYDPILICDDISDTGKTLKETYDYYSPNHSAVLTVTLHIRESTTFAPTFAGRTVKDSDGYLIYPWEVSDDDTPLA